MAEGVLFSVAEGILGKLGSYAVQEIGLWWGLKDEIDLLHTTLLGVKIVLVDAEERQARGDQEVKEWLCKLKDIVYDADDLLDDFSTEVLRRKVMTGNKVAKEVRLFFSSSNQVAYGLKMGHKIKAIRERLDAVVRVGNHFNFRQRPVDPFVTAKKREQSYSTVPEVVVGREDDKKAIKHLLLSTNCETNVCVVSIVGIGGLGKTTLAQLAYNDEEVRLHFELRMWVCVSDDFSAKLIVEKILESVSGEKPNIGEMDTLKDSLNKKIGGKRYFLVLDDVWNEDFEKWCHVRDLLAGGARGSRIIVTTRSKKVAEITSTVPQAQHVLNGLSEEESWSLFVQMAFKQGCEQPTSSHKAIGTEIVGKCKGSPLAIRTIGRLLYFKETIFEWESFKNKELTSLDQGESGILSTLKLSYDHLPSHLKYCFAYCRLFPKDHVIDVETLVAFWMAQGYVRSSDLSQRLEDIALDYFQDLLWRSFFQEVEKDEMGNITSCKMHDLMHDLASSVAGVESACVSIPNSIGVGEKTRHISFDHLLTEYSGPRQVPTFVLEAKSLRTFLDPKISYTYRKLSEGQCQTIFSNFRRLRQLDLQQLDIEIVPHSISKLKQLRYLNLSHNGKIRMLPLSITRLHNLQVLNLNCCSGLTQLPKDVKKLVNLKQLKLDGCSLTHMPQKIGQLTSLERLTKFVLPRNSNWKKESQSGGLCELHDLNNLGGKLQIENLPHENGKYNQKSTVAETAAAAANFREKSRLQCLGLDWVWFGDSDSDDIDDEMTLEALRPHPNLKKLSLRNYVGMKIASWLSSLTNLVSLQLYDCRKCQSLPALDQFPSLKDLAIWGLPDLEYIDIESCVVGGGCSSSSSSMVSFFPSLENLWLKDCPNLKGWRPSPSPSSSSSSSSSSSLFPQFQRLSLLAVSSCPNLTSMPPFPSLKSLDLGSGSFKSLEQMLKATISPAHTPSSSLPSNLSSLTSLLIDRIEHLPEDFLPMELIQTLTSLESLLIWNCPKLICIPHEKMLHLSSLKRLRIWDCEDLDLSIYDDDDDDGNSNDDVMLCQDLRNLTSLEIDGIPKLEHLPKRLLLHLVVLQSLDISQCYNLASLPDWMPNITSLQYLTIKRCSQVSERCNNNMGEDWPKIAHIPNIVIDRRKIQWNGCYQL